MRGFVYDCLEDRFLEVEVELLDGCARKGDFVVFDDGTMSFCCKTEMLDGEPSMLVFDVGCVDGSDIDDLSSLKDGLRYSAFCVSAFDARPCEIYALNGR